jgi:hypothetical protein
LRNSTLTLFSEQAFCGSGQPKASAGELAVLKRKNARLQQENEILKKQRRTSRENCREVRLDPDAGAIPGAGVVPGVPKNQGWLSLALFL